MRNPKPASKPSLPSPAPGFACNYMSIRPSSLPFVHDDMYFGDSKFSIGIQIADLCSYFIAGHLEGDSEKEHFYKLIDPQIISAASG
jgi:hypothetical protein